MQPALIPNERIVNQIYVIRGRKVMLDRDLAELYGVETRALTQAVRRNMDRFPEDFMFQIDRKEFEILKSQIVTSSWGGTRKLPLAFSEQGVSMLSSVLHSKQAIKMNILIIRAFVRMREMLETSELLRLKLKDLENHLGKHDNQIKKLYTVLQHLLDEPIKPKNPIGFQITKK
jgi:hypothetical protein